MKNRYFDHLCSIVGRSQEFGMLLDDLHRINFYSLVPNDDNRASDGLRLREYFIDEYGSHLYAELPSQKEATVLEVMVALSYRLEFETAQSKWEKTIGEWFWILIDNLGLSNNDDEAYINNQTVSKKTVNIINRWLSREYEPNGNGGLFPLIKPKKDQRRIEIWYQMTEYIIENYPIEF